MSSPAAPFRSTAPPFIIYGHHVDEWTGQIGDTNLNRLVPICPHDHHRIHEGGWTLALDTDPARTITLIRPDGTTEYHGPSITPTAERGLNRPGIGRLQPMG